MVKIVIISSSVRSGRVSHRVALYLKNLLDERKLAVAEILDLDEYDFPIFSERLKYQDTPLQRAVDFAEKVKSSDGIIIVTPEYNGGYPASIKNAVDLLTSEWYHKPVAISTVSDGSFGGTQVLISLQFVLWKIKALTIPAMFPNPKADIAYNEYGVPAEKEITDKRALNFISELLWVISAREGMEKNSTAE